MFDHTAKRNTAVPMAVLAALLMVCAAVVVASDVSEATGEDLMGYGEVHEIEIAPGYQWSYTVEIPEDLTEGAKLSAKVNDLGAGNVKIEGLKVTITIPDGFTSGKYNLVLQVDHEASGQTTYQWIRFTVNDSMKVSHTGTLNEIIAGATQTITLVADGGVGDVTWSTVSMPAGLTLSGSKITGTPTKIGENNIQVRATSEHGETADLEITFTVYNKIVGGADETITSAGAYVASTAVTQTGDDLNVTWRVTSGTLPAGFTLDASTGVVSGTYTGTEATSVTVTITGTANNGPDQSATKKITIRAEPSFSLSASESKIVTYPGKGNTTVTVTASAEVSEITWSASGIEGVTVADGKVTIPDSSASGTITVTAKTEYGQTKTVTIAVTAEGKLSITGPGELSATAGKSATSGAFTISGGSGNTVKITSDGGFGAGVTWSDESKTVSVSYPSAHTGTVTITVTSAGGQTATATIEITVSSELVITSEPEFDGIYAYVKG